MILLHTLPREHPLRNIILKGAHVRYTPLVEPEVTDGPVKRAEVKARAAAGERRLCPWKLCEPGWPVSRCTYNQLGDAWTDGVQWTFSKIEKGK